VNLRTAINDAHSPTSPATDRAHQRYLETRRFGSLDGLRCFCILGVIWHHTAEPSSVAILKRGFLGVDMFFVLSGFLIVTLLLRERQRTSAISLRKFYARRSLRIFPIYYLLIFTVLFLYLWKPGSTNARAFLAIFPFLVTYTSNWIHVTAGNFGIMWSLATEEQFYVVWPLMEKYLKPLFLAIALGVVLLVNQLINFGALDGLFAHLYGGRPHLPILDATFTPIALGVLLAHLLHSQATFRPLYRLIGHPWSSVILGAILLALIASWPGDLSGLGRLLIQVTMMMFLAALVVREDQWAAPLLRLAPLAYLGTISYGMYLYHMWAIHPIRLAFTRFGWGVGTVPFFLAATLATTVIAGLSFQVFEQPLLNLKARFATAPEGPNGDDVPTQSADQLQAVLR
jgi:peptidoglycan/LPS O-acetylase OafA/YrhL